MPDVAPPASVPPRIASRRTNARALGFIIGGVVLACVALLFFFNPGQYGFYPRCAFFTLTGLQCPGCGGLRATHQLLHGNFVEAFKLNALVIVGLPLVAWGTWQQVARGGLKLRVRWIILMGIALLLFGVVRNLSGFEWLAP